MPVRRRPLALPVLTMAAARLATLAVMYLAGRVKGVSFNSVAAAWDGTHYIYNAANGFPEGVFINGEYKGAALAFYPLYSLLLRLARPLGVSYTATGLVLSFAASLLVAALVWLLVRDWLGDRAANAAAILFAAFPGTTVLSLIYAEGVMLAAAAACLLALRHRRWLLAGIAAAVATSARPNAIVLVLCCAYAAFDAIRQRRDLASLVAPALAPLGALAYHLYLWRHTGDVTEWFDVQRDGWNERFSPLSIVDFARHLGDKPHELQELTVLLGTAFAVAALVLLVKAKPPPTLLLWTIGILFLVFTSNNLGVRPRFAMTAFPLFGALGLALRDKPLALTGVTASFAVLSAAYVSAAVATVTLIP